MLRETNNLSELKTYIIDWVNSTDDEKQLKKTAKSIAKENSDWWDELPAVQQKRITKALKNVEAGKRVVDHEEVFSTLKQKQKNRKKQ